MQHLIGVDKGVHPVFYSITTWYWSTLDKANIFQDQQDALYILPMSQQQQWALISNIHNQNGQKNKAKQKCQQLGKGYLQIEHILTIFLSNQP